MFWKSNGVVRALSIIVLISGYIPALQPYQAVFIALGSALGIGGVANAATAPKA